MRVWAHYIVQLSYHKIVTLFVACVYFWVSFRGAPFLHIPGWGRPGVARQKIRDRFSIIIHLDLIYFLERIGIFPVVE